MTATVTGIYKEGKIELLETPEGLREGEIRLILLDIAEPKETLERQPQYLQFGKYKNNGRQESTLEDFKEAEWHGEEEFDDTYGDNVDK